MPTTNQEQFVNTRTSTSDLRIVREVTGSTEPVTLAEAKNYLRITNTQDDTLITSMIESARKNVERWLNSDIVPKERQVFYDNLTEEINLYYAPIASITSVTVEGTAQVLDEGYEVIGLDNPLIRLINNGGFAERVQIVYTTSGVSDASIKQAVLCYIAFLYHGRDSKVNTNWKAFASPYKIYGYYGVR